MYNCIYLSTSKDKVDKYFQKGYINMSTEVNLQFYILLQIELRCYCIEERWDFKLLYNICFTFKGPHCIKSSSLAGGLTQLDVLYISLWNVLYEILSVTKTDDEKSPTEDKMSSTEDKKNPTDAYLCLLQPSGAQTPSFRRTPGTAATETRPSLSAILPLKHGIWSVRATGGSEMSTTVQTVSSRRLSHPLLDCTPAFCNLQRELPPSNHTCPTFKITFCFLPLPVFCYFVLLLT